MTYSNSNTSGALMSRKDAANYLGVSPQTLAAWAFNRRYGPPFVKIGRGVIYFFADLQAFIKCNTFNKGVLQ